MSEPSVTDLEFECTKQRKAREQREATESVLKLWGVVRVIPPKHCTQRFVCAF